MEDKELKNLQELADNVCKKFKIEPIPIAWNPRLRTTSGLYRGTKIEINPRTISKKATLLHELAHHLRKRRFHQRVEGYYLISYFPKLEPVKDMPGFYAPTGPLELVCYHEDSAHSKLFKKCLKEIIEFCTKQLKK